MMFVSEQKLN